MVYKDWEREIRKGRERIEMSGRDIYIGGGDIYYRYDY